MHSPLAHERTKIVSEYDQEIPQSQIADNPVAPQEEPLNHLGTRGGQGVRTSPEKSQTIGFRRNTGPDPLKNLKATKPAFNNGPS